MLFRWTICLEIHAKRVLIRVLTPVWNALFCAAFAQTPPVHSFFLHSPSIPFPHAISSFFSPFPVETHQRENLCNPLHLLAISDERTCAAPMFGFGNWWQSLWTNGCLELYLKGLSIGISWRPFIGFKAIRRRICVDQGYSWSYPKIGHVDQHTKRRRCTKRDRVISWYGKHCPLRFVY